MQFTIDQQEFSAKLSEVLPYVSTTSSHPILSTILVTCKEGEIELIAFDLQNSIRTKATAFDSSNGSACVPGKLLHDIVSKFPADDLKLSASGNLVSISCGSSSCQISCLPCEDFPEMPPHGDNDRIECEAKDLSRSIASALYAASTDASKQILCGVNLLAKDGKLTVAATDGHRLAVADAIPFGQPLNLTLSLKSSFHLLKCLARSETVIVGYSEKSPNISFCFGDTVLSFRVLDGQYPMYAQLIPSQWKHSIVVDRAALTQAIGRSSVFLGAESSLVDLRFSEGKLVVAVTRSTLGQFSEPIDAENPGQYEGTLTFNVKYLASALSHIDCERVVININSATTPVTIVPESAVVPISLVMPIQVRQ
jgi:DNA polymerase-3 subunit beta